MWAIPFEQKIKRMRISVLLAILPFLLFTSCRKAPRKPKKCDFSNETNDFFTIQGNDDSPARAFNVFCKKVDVFGVMVYGISDLLDEDLLHAANILAQYLDNDEDGVVDNQLVLDNMIANNACLVMFDKQNSSLKRRFYRSIGDDFDEAIGQELFGDETHPDWSYNSPFDATLEEVLHLVTQNGYSKSYPAVFGEAQGSSIANAMDLARGGTFTSIPSSYPSGAWYTYDDKTCEYNCQVTEYFYWALTSLLGAQGYPGRYDEIGNEWRANTPELVETMDPVVFALLTDSTYKLPTVLPDGSYRR